MPRHPSLGRVAALKQEPNGQLRLAWIAGTNAQETVKVEQRRRGQRVHIVLVVEGVKHFDRRNDCVPVAELDWASRAPIKRNVFIVFPDGISLAAWFTCTVNRSNRLGSVSLDSTV